MSATSERNLRSDSRRNHLSHQEVTRRQSGPVITLTPEQIAAMSPNTPTKVINVTKTDEQAKESLSWDEMQEELRKACSIMVWDTVSAIKRRATPAVDATSVEVAGQLSAIVKRHIVVTASNDIDLSKIPTSEIEKATAK